jgi:hypothetical protein
MTDGYRELVTRMNDAWRTTRSDGVSHLLPCSKGKRKIPMPRRRELHRLLACVAIGAVAPVMLANRASAAHAWMTGPEIIQHFTGATIDGRYASGKAFTERYERDGRVSYVEPMLKLGGHWSVTAGTLCTIYDGDAFGGCYRVTRVAPNCFEFYYVSPTEEAAPGPRDGTPRWTARGALQGQGSACKDAPSV